ncbi:hypothetical protein [Nocardia terpenica]|uniref:Uncharacterized protein n=1 Tax=Nocardia terpenica TaxID=455432 RepID=A0A6G9ZB40_9NOCA|nr:hypothetical protein [Nocardia terpenica]QIS22611.1 hypothetical protein F6W96_34015 [Nocardia terpenica]
MSVRAFVLPICAAAVLLSACTAGPTSPAPVAVGGIDKVRGDLDGLVRSGAVGALAASPAPTS